VRIYLDTSAAMKLVTAERESPTLQVHLGRHEEAVIFSSVLLETELRRGAEANGATQAEATAVLAGVHLVDAPRTLFREAGLLRAPGLRSLDALHLATALRHDVEVLLAYDRRLLEAAQLLGLSTSSPGR
jgi:uncharacterized protein